MIFDPELPHKVGYTLKKDEITGQLYYQERSSGAMRMETVTYVGTGVYGADNPTEVILPFRPKMLIFWKGGYASLWGLYGDTALNKMDYDGTTSGLTNVVWDGNKVSWYSENKTGDQQNVDGTIYKLLAIG